jgi:hypothetical protein
VTQGLITVNITADSKDYQVNITAGSTVQEAINSAQITLGELDRVEPPLYTVLSDGSQVQVVRVREEYYVEQVIIPFDHQELRNEALPEGERRLSQPGVNGLEEITYRRVYEDEVEVSNSVVKSVILQEAVPEVVMIGSQSAFASIAIPGQIAYLSAGNAWVMENTTGNRRLAVSTGDLDGRIFSLSNDGNWLLFSRFSSDENIINTLWAAWLQSDPPTIIDLGVTNIVHFAKFGLGSSVIAYSTVESRSTAPGWQANNDLWEIGVSSTGFVSAPRMEIEANSGGVYGWWGMEFFWAADEVRFLYSRPDGVGIFDSRDDTLTPLLNITPYQTGGNWAWVPGAAWSPDGNIIYTVDHVSSSDPGASEESQQFDLLAIPLTGGLPAHLVQDVGMFAYPSPSPLTVEENSLVNDAGTSLNQNSYLVAYLQSIFPEQSGTSRYRLFIIDRDGSNQKALFPEEGAVGLDPQQVMWSPESMGTDGSYAIAVIYQGNVWLVDTTSGLAQQITGDGLTIRLDWR